MEVLPVASIRVRKETGKLFLDFRYKNQRCREQTDLMDSPENRTRLEAMLHRIQIEILLGSFCYSSTFPNSKRLGTVIELDNYLKNNGVKMPLFEDYAVSWYEDAKSEWGRMHIGAVRFMVVKRLIPFFGHMKINEIDRTQLKIFRNQIIALQNGDGDPITSGHVNKHLIRVQSILKHAAECYGFQAPKPLKLLKEKPSDTNPFTSTEISLFLENVREDFRDYYLVRFFTGMRSSEIDGLKWKYVDLDRKQILIRETLVNGHEHSTKTDSSHREIEISEPVFEAIKRMQDRTGNHVFVFCNEDGTSLVQHKVTKKVWYPCLKNLGLKPRNPYQTRHTAASLWLASGESPEWIARQLGHADTSMLFRVYSRYVPNLSRQDGIQANKQFLQISGV
jgi:integrase